jgi:hypothetical protein
MTPKSVENCCQRAVRAQTVPRSTRGYRERHAELLEDPVIALVEMCSIVRAVINHEGTGPPRVDRGTGELPHAVPVSPAR